MFAQRDVLMNQPLQAARTQGQALRAAAADIIESCRRHGMTVPLSICAVSPNGYVAAIRTDGHYSQTIAEHHNDADAQAPLLVVVTDPSGLSVEWQLSPI